MFISHWFEVSGLDQVLAPSTTPRKPDRGNGGEGEDVGRGAAGEEAEDYAPIWDILAPRHDGAPPVATVPPPPGDFVTCVHCHRLTPVDRGARGPPRTPAGRCTTPPNASYLGTSNSNGRPAATPRGVRAATLAANVCDDDDGEFDAPEFRTAAILEEQAFLRAQVLQAAEDTALTSSGPTFLWENKLNLFTACAAAPKPAKKDARGKPVPPKLDKDGAPVRSKNLKKLARMLQGRPELRTARSAGMQASLGLPDGFTVLHAACHAGNAEVAAYLLERHVRCGGAEEQGEGGAAAAPLLDLSARDLQGRTALHVAAHRGHVELARLLRGAYDALEAREAAEADDSSDEDEDEAAAPGATEAATRSARRVGASAPPPAAASHGPRRSVKSQRPGGTPKTPRSPPRPRRGGLGSRSPRPPPSAARTPRRSPVRSPVAFSGPAAPVDLAGRTPLGCAATSPVPAARRRRAELEGLLYGEGDRSIVGVGHGGRTPPKARCGPAPARRGGGAAGEHGRSPGPARAHDGASPAGSAASTVFATPFQFQSPPTIPEEEAADAIVEICCDGAEEEEARAPRLLCGWSEMNGWRIEMEDKILARPALYGPGELAPPRPVHLTEMADAGAAVPKMGLFGVFDGHGDGGFASAFVAARLERELKARPAWPEAYHTCNAAAPGNGNGNGNDGDGAAPLMATVLADACHALDEALRRDATKPRDGGTTAVFALVSDDRLFVANVGDSRCVLVTRDGAAAGGDGNGDAVTAVALSEDHKPGLPAERARIEAAGLAVQTDLVPPEDGDDPDGAASTVDRVKKSDTELLGVSRAFGDYDYKGNPELAAARQAVVCTPDVVVRARDNGDGSGGGGGGDLFLVLACDGVWDVMTNDEVGRFVVRGVEEFTAMNGVSASASSLDFDENNPADNYDDNSVQGEVLAQVGDDLLAECLRKGSRDNMSVLIVALPASGLLSGENGTSSSLSRTLAGKKDVEVKEEVPRPAVAVDNTVRAKLFT